MVNYFFSGNRAIHEILWKYMVEPERPQVTWRMRIAYWTIKTTNPHLEYGIIIVSPQQQWLQERASLLRYTYIACLVYISSQCFSVFLKS
jgi:hypothetical protein